MREPSKYWKLRKEYENSIGYKIYSIMRNLDVYKYFVERNLQDVLKAIDHYDKNWMSLWTIKRPQGDRDLDNFMVEFLRLLFNYLMAAKTLGDKTSAWRRHLKKRYEDRITQDEYDQKLNDFGVLKYGEFLDQLRNELAHNPDKGGFRHISFNMGQNECRGEWGAIFFKQLKKEVKKIVLDFNKTTTHFQAWFIEKLQEVFAEEIKEAKRLNKIVLQMQGTPFTKTNTKKKEK